MILALSALTAAVDTIDENLIPSHCFTFRVYKGWLDGHVTVISVLGSSGSRIVRGTRKMKYKTSQVAVILYYYLLQARE